LDQKFGGHLSCNISKANIVFVKAGIVGYGLAGRYFHAPTLCAAGFEVAAICTRSLERKANAHSDFPSAIIVNSIEELLDEDLDLVIIASTNEVHFEQAKLSIDRGFATVVDKPMTLNYQDAQTLFDLADSKGVALTVFFNRLWDSDALTVKRVVSQGVLGNTFRLDSRYERFRPELNPAAWRENAPATQGGGLLLDLQSHLVSTALDWFGDGELVFASVRSIRGASDDDVVLVFKHFSGVDSYLSTSSIVGAPGPRIRLSGSLGSLVINDLDHQEGFMRKGLLPKEGEWISESEISSEARIFKGDSSFNFPSVAGDYPAFYRSVRQSLEIGSTLPIARDFALRVAQIIDQARYLSVRDV
jgi:scyllo-inositol 2-dehydrogenase (NADP+)